MSLRLLIKPFDEDAHRRAARCVERRAAAISAQVLYAQLAMLRGERDAAIAHLRAAAPRDPANVNLVGRIVDDRLGRLLGAHDPEGAARIESTRAWAEREATGAPRRFIGMLMPVASLRS